MTWRRAAALAAVVAFAIGTLTGLSHIGQSTLSKCGTGSWWAVVGRAADPLDAATNNSRASQMVAPSACSGSQKDGHGGYYAFTLFKDEASAQAYVDALVQAGYAAKWHFTPYVTPALPPPKTTTQ